MSRFWPMQEARNKFSHLVDEAIHQRPQIITRHGVQVAIVLSYQDYQKTITSRQKLSEFFGQSPWQVLTST